jgi:hypothetical protein
MYTFLGSLGLLFANNIIYFMPQILLISLTALSGGMMINVFIESKWKTLFTNLGLVNTQKQTPKLIRKEKNDLGDRYIFTIPEGYCLSDFEKVHEELEVALCKSLKLDLTKDFNIAMQIFDAEYKSVYKPNKEVYLNE